MEYGFERVSDHNLARYLDESFSNTGSRETIEHEGKVYRRRFYPLVKQGPRRRPSGKLGGGKVTRWGSYWEERKELSEFSSIEALLEHRFFSARSGEVVILNGMRYRARFSPEFSRSYKTIHNWQRSWECLGPVE